ncbi:hypothetical protein [Aeromonas enteropelogenes]|uniref:hypothetical protein n=1 Tax=Aeromonas enteropelogenes TaxID=29489 RepID=UPI003B9E7207
MGRFKQIIWVLLLGWLWLQPALAQHPLDASLPEHDHHCLICALHLDGNQAIPPSIQLLPPTATWWQPVDIIPAEPPRLVAHAYAIRAPPRTAFLFPSI